MEANLDGPGEQLYRSSLEIFARLGGPLISGDALVRSLGYPSRAAMQMAAHRDRVPVPTFSLPHRRQKFALTMEVLEWLVQRRMEDCSLPIVKVRSSTFASFNRPVLEILRTSGPLMHESDIRRHLKIDEAVNLEEMRLPALLGVPTFKLAKRNSKVFVLAVEMLAYLDAKSGYQT